MSQVARKGNKDPQQPFLDQITNGIYKARANLPGPGRTDSAGPENINMIFRIIRTVPSTWRDPIRAQKKAFGFYESHL
jgi:hypothetical protein